MASPRSPRRRLTGIATAVAKLVLSVGLMTFVLRGTSPQTMWAMLRRVQPWWLAAAFATNVVVMAVSIWRWRILLAAQHVVVPTRTLSESYWVALFFNNFLPSNIGGDVVRIADTSQAAGSKTLATTVVLVDRVLGAFALLTVSAVGAAGARALGVDIPGTGWLDIAALAALGVCIPLFVAPGLLDTLLRPLHASGHPWVIERLEMLTEALGRFRSRPSSLIGALAGAVAVQVVIVVFYALTARSLSIPLPVMMAGVLVPVALVVQMAPVSINGFGVREAVFSFFFVRFGLGVEAGVAVSLLGTALVMLFSLGGGALFLLRRR